MFVSCSDYRVFWKNNEYSLSLIFPNMKRIFCTSRTYFFQPRKVGRSSANYHTIYHGHKILSNSIVTDFDTFTLFFILYCKGKNSVSSTVEKTPKLLFTTHPNSPRSYFHVETLISLHCQLWFLLFSCQLCLQLHWILSPMVLK